MGTGSLSGGITTRTQAMAVSTTATPGGTFTPGKPYLKRSVFEGLATRGESPADRQTSTTESAKVSGTTKQQASSSRKNTNFSSKMARDYTGQMDTGHNTGIQDTAVLVQPGGKPGNYTGDRISSEERSCSSFSISKGWLHKQCLLGTQEQGKTILNLKALNQFVIHKHFKMEDIRCVKNLLNGGGTICANWTSRMHISQSQFSCHSGNP